MSMIWKGLAKRETGGVFVKLHLIICWQKNCALQSVVGRLLSIFCDANICVSSVKLWAYFLSILFYCELFCLVDNMVYFLSLLRLFLVVLKLYKRNVKYKNKKFPYI